MLVTNTTLDKDRILTLAPAPRMSIDAPLSTQKLRQASSARAITYQIYYPSFSNDR